MRLKGFFAGIPTSRIATVAMLLATLTTSNSILAQDSLAVSSVKDTAAVALSSAKHTNAHFRKDCLRSKDSLLNAAQFSVVPGVSTQRHNKNPKATYDFSFNVVMGNVYSVRYMELSAVLNHDESNVSYVQGAGVGNIVGGTVRGIQYAGVFNTTGCVAGFQYAGVINRVNGCFVGGQHAGVANFVSGDFTGAQLVGVINHTDSIHGFQGAGVLNHAGSVRGTQASGVLNRAKNVRGAQLTGVINSADNVNGVQISGVVNRAKEVKGFQLGWVNIADTIDGACLGLVNVVSRGYNRWELSGDEVFYANVAYRSGVHKLHTILSAGMMPEKFDGPTWTFGAGLGMSLGNPRKTLFDIDLTTQQVVERDRFKENHLLYKVYLGIDQPLSRKFSLAVGVTYNFFFYNEGEQNRISEIMPKSIYRENLGGHTMIDSWIGGKVALRFR